MTTTFLFFLIIIVIVVVIIVLAVFIYNKVNKAAEEHGTTLEQIEDSLSRILTLNLHELAKKKLKQYEKKYYEAQKPWAWIIVLPIQK